MSCLRGIKSNSIIGFLHTNFIQLIKLAKKDYVALLIIFSVALISCGYTAHSIFVDTVVPTGVPLMESLRERWIHIQDVGEYIKMVEGEPAISPFRFRILTPFLVSLLVEVSHVAPSLTIRSVELLPFSTIEGFILVNFLFILLTSIIFYYFLQEFDFDKKTSLIGVLLFLSSLSVLMAGGIPLVDAGTYFFMLCGFYSIKRKNIPLFLIFTCLGILNKEIILLLAPVFLFVNLNYKNLDKVSQKLGVTIENILISIPLPLMTFMLLRKFIGGGLFEVSYGYQLFKLGWLNEVITRYSNFGRVCFEFIGIFLTFLFAWLGIIYLKRNEFLMKSAIVAIPLTVISQILLAGSVMRLLFVCFPIIIPAFLYFITKMEED